MSRKFVEEAQIVSIIEPVNLGAGANAGDWVSMKNYGRIVFIIAGAVGGAGEPIVPTIVQATAAAGTGSKALNFTRYDRKMAATDLTGTGQFTKVTAAAGNTISLTGDQAKLAVIEINAEDLDTDNGFTFVSCTIADPGASQVGCVIALLLDPRYPQETQPSVLA
jgi:hypothetical protein